MAIRKIARMGHPVLHEVCAPVANPTAPEVAALARDLLDTCEDLGGNGIAAFQVYEPVRMSELSTLGYVSELGPAAYPNLPRDPADFVDPEP